MVSIHRLPPFGKRFFKRIRKILGCTHFSHLWRIVIGLASLPGKKSLSKFTRLYGHRRSRQAISHFLTEAEWDVPELLLENALSMLRRLGYKSGDTVYLIVDDTQKHSAEIVMACQPNGRRLENLSSCQKSARNRTYHPRSGVRLSRCYRALRRPALGKQGLL